MAPRARFNLALLRSLGGPWRDNSASRSPEEAKISRRTFLGVSVTASVAAAFSPFFLGDEFSVVREGQRAHVMLHGKPRWTIDPTNFGEAARLAIRKQDSRIELALRDATFPGTTLSAEFDSLLIKQADVWMMKMDMACGMRLEAALLPWLKSQLPARGCWDTHLLRPFEGLQIAFRESPEVEFTRDWLFELSGRARTSIDGLHDHLPTDHVRMEVGQLNSQARIAAEPSAPATSFHLERGSHTWHINLLRGSERGWSLVHDEDQELFDELHVEATPTSSGPLQSALLYQSADNGTPLRFFTGGGLVSDSGDPFHLSLTNPRLAFTLNEPQVSSALVANLSALPTWAHGEHASYQIAGTAQACDFELLDNGDQGPAPKVTPGIYQICFPDDATAMNLRFGVPRPFRLTWADIKAPFERLWGILHLLPSRHALDIEFDDNPTPDHLLQIDRPNDLLSLRFQFKNMRLITGLSPRIVLRDKKLPGLVSVIFPPQHVAEEAFFHTDDNIEDPNQKIAVDVPIGDVEVRRTLSLPDGAVLSNAQTKAAKAQLDPDYGTKAPNKDSARPRTVRSGDSRLVFSVPAGESEIPFHLEGLLDWTKWEPRVAEVAQTKVNVSNYKSIPSIVEPRDVTAVEIPYKVILSPSELGRWVHSIQPVKHQTNIVELWHTRLAVAAQAAAAGKEPLASDESNSKDRTVRAIWSPDYVGVDRSCTVDPNMVARSDSHPDGLGFPGHYITDAAPNTFDDPFRMSLDSRDRCELVHLTSNYRIPKPANSCVLEPTADQLLPPAPVAVERMMLTSVGGYLKSYGFWEPAKVDQNHQLTVEQWRHIATLGRDHYVRVVYKGYLLPFGHRASLVKVTERKIVVNKLYPQKGFVAILHQRMFIVVQRPIKDFPVLGQPSGGRQIPFRRIESLTLITPDIDAPQDQFPANPKRTQNQSLFWPMVNGQAYPFRFRFTDMGGAVSEASLPVVFADAAVSQNGSNSTDLSPFAFGPHDATDLYNAGTGKVGQKDDGWTAASFSNQKVAFAAPAKPGDTQYDADVLAFSTIQPAATVNVLDLYANDLPYFYPTLRYARISSTSIKRVTGKSDSTLVVFFQGYLNSGFDPQGNRGEVVLQVHDENPLTLAFGGASGNVDKAGGLASPDIKVAGFSRKSGPIGGTPPQLAKGAPVPTNPAPTPSLTTYSSGNFNAGDFFGGLTSAKILGGIKLSDIIAPLAPGLASNLEKAPQMLEQSVFEIEKVIKGIVEAIQALQTPTLTLPGGGSISNPLAAHLAPQAQQVLALYDASDLAHKRTQADPEGSLALLADTVAEADVDRQLVGAIKDYATALESLLSNPVALAEQTLVTILTDFLLKQINTAGLSLEAQFAAFITALQNDLEASGAAQTALGIATTSLQALANVALVANETDNAKVLLSDTLRIARDNLQGTAKDAAVLALSQYAPDLLAACNVIDKAQDLQQRVQKLISNVSLTAIPGFFEQLNGVLDDLLQIYQSAGFLGIVAVNLSVVDEIKAAEDDIANIWRQVSYVANLTNNATAAIAKIKGDIQGLEDTCLKLAAKLGEDKADVARKLLQNLRQVQRAVDSIDSYKDQLQPSANLGPEAVLRLNQLLQQFQRQILASLAALQDMAHDTTADLASAATAAGITLIAFEGQLTSLAEELTAATTLIGSGGQPGPLEKRIDQSLAKPATAAGAAAVGDLLSGPLGEINSSVKTQILGLRTKLTAAPNVLSLQLLHYDLCLQMQQSFAAGLEWSIFQALGTIPTAVKTALAGLNQINSLATAINSRISSALVSALCPLKTFWLNFVQQLTTGPEPEPTVHRLFQGSLDSITAALTTLCNDSAVPVPRPSILIADARSVFAAFKALVDDIRSRITSLAGLPQEALDFVISFAKQKLNDLIQAIPVPKSVALSYDWHPKIQPFEPVFLLDEGADFVVSAKATISVPLPGAAPPSVDITASLTKFSINLIGSPSFVIVKIDSLRFTSHNGSSPDCRVAINTVEFGKDMSFVKSLAAALNPSKGPFIELSDSAIKAGFRFAVDSLPSAGMTVMGLAIEVAVALPLNGDPVRCEFGISDQQHPFLLSFGIYGGGGFLQLQLGLDGVQLLQGALEFGLVSSISIGPLHGDGFVVGGIYFRIAGSDARVCGFVHAHGHMDIFGIISLDVDLYVGMCYDNSVVTGTATFSVHVSILFFSEDFSLQASYTFGGSNGGNSQGMLEPYMDPRYERGELATAAFLVSPREAVPVPQVTPNAEPVFISKDDWIAYLNAFDLEPQGA